MGRDTLPAFPSHSFPYCYRKSYHFIDSLKPPVYWWFEAALPLQTAAASGCLFTPSCYGMISISGKKYRIAILVKIAILCCGRTIKKIFSPFWGSICSLTKNLELSRLGAEVSRCQSVSGCTDLSPPLNITVICSFESTTTHSSSWRTIWSSYSIGRFFMPSSIV